MAIYRPSELCQFLNSLGIFPKKGLSQNFLVDGNIIRNIIKASELKAGDLVLEIGPGPGAITEQLLETGATVVAVEKDAPLADALQRLQTSDNRLKVICEDILKVPLQECFSHHSHTDPVKVIANLPFHLTTPIITRLATQNLLFSSLTVVVQEEVARRMTAKPGTKEYSSLTVFLNFYTRPTYCFTVSHSCFYPRPKVNSAIVSLVLKEPPIKKRVEAFFLLTRTAFEQRRKMLRASLKDLYSSTKVLDALALMHKKPTARPEELRLDEFIELFQVLDV